MASTTVSKNEVTSEEVRRIVKEEMRNRDYDNYIISLITRTDLDSRVRDLVDRNLKGTVQLSTEKAVNDYNKNHLPDKIRSNLTEMLQKLLPSMIKGEILEKLGNLSGVENLMSEYRGQIQLELQQQAHDFRKAMTDQLSQISGIRERQIHEFNIQARQLATDLVRELVASNGLVIQGFKEELARQNLDNFNRVKNENTQDVVKLKDKYKRLEESLSSQKWVNTGLGLGLVCSLAMLGYLLMK